MDIHHLGADHGEEEPNSGRAQQATECEAAVALSLSRTVTRDMVTVANQLAWRLPAIDAAFSSGDLDYARVRTIALTLLRATDSTVSALEPDVLAAAMRCNSRTLRENIWRQWIAHDPDEAAAAQKAAVSEERCADVRRGDDGIATLIAKMSILEGAECDAILEEYAGTVCSGDPRTKKQLRGHALLAIFHREESIACMCTSEKCPVAVATAFDPPRRKPLLNIHIDIETLLGLTDSPATLADGTVIDPEIARLIATDARWQLFFTEMLEAAQAHKKRQQSNEVNTPFDESISEGDPEHLPENSESGDGNDNACDSGSSAGDSSDGGSSVTTPRERSGKRARARRMIGRGKTRPAAPLPTRGKGSRRPARSSTAGDEVALSKAIADFLSAAAADPALSWGLHPDGHGGCAEPPPGALTYRPNAELVALVRATYSTCTFPNCSVPASRCDIDHIVPFDHDNPRSGGWTILDNLQPLCGYHHHAKTLRLWACAKLEGDGIYWRSGSGLNRITPAHYGTVTVPEYFVHHRHYRPPGSTSGDARDLDSETDPSGTSRTTDNADSARATQDQPSEDVAPDCVDPDGIDPDAIDPDSIVTDAVDEEQSDSPSTEPANPETVEPPEELYEPTWWEMNMSGGETRWHTLLTVDPETGAPTLGDIARLNDPRERADARYLRTRFLEHRAIVAQRERHRPPPF